MNFSKTLFFLFMPAFLIWSAKAAPLDDILRLAESKSTAESRAWKKLLHIEPNAIGFKKTQVTDSKFFLSQQSDSETDNELEATLRGFYQPAQKFAQVMADPLKKDLQITDHSQHPICRFPARLKYLKSQLGEVKSYWVELPEVRCRFQEIFMNALDPLSVSFVFSSYYSDSPGSAFGHTFFRMNRKSNQGPRKQELLDYGIGYAANVTVSNGALYAILGLVGGFTGSWTNLPYYYKVREYNDFEARDLWSYDLNLSPDEVDTLALHFWEVGAHFYTYYFFTQNCAFHMLTMLEAAAPRLHLTEHVPFLYVIPSDSMKALFYERDFVKNVSFRPSVRRKFLERYHLLDDDQIGDFKSYAKSQELPGSLSSQPEQKQARFVDTSLDLMDLRYPNMNAETQPVEFKRKEALLLKRAQLNAVSEELKDSTETAEDPSKSHSSSRLSLGYQEKNSLKFGQLDYRFALHDLQDPQYGLPRNSQLEFFNLHFKILPNELRFDSFELFKVLNLNPIQFFEKKASWGVDFGTQSKAKYCAPDSGVCYLQGFGFRYGYSAYLIPGSESTIVWGLGTVNARYGANLLNEKTYLAPGYEIGLLARFTDKMSLLAHFGREYAVNREYEQDYEVSYQFSLTKDLNLLLSRKNDSSNFTGMFYF